MIDINEFRQNATKDGLCAEYTILWDNCKSKKQLMDLVLSVKGIDYLCDAIAKGWGVSPDYIEYKFGAYINGRYRYEDKYSSTIYCKFNGEIECNTTALTLICCNVNVVVPKNHICEIYATGNTNITLSGEGRCVVIAYGNAEEVIVNVDSENIHYKRIQKKEKDRHDE